MELTPNLKLAKQNDNEYYDIDIFNKNFQEIDDYMKTEFSPATVEVNGRTLVNLLGRAGNAVYKQYSIQPGVGSKTYTADFYNDRFRFTMTADTPSLSASIGMDVAGGGDFLDNGKYYILVGEVICTNITNKSRIIMRTGISLSKYIEANKGTVWHAIQSDGTYAPSHINNYFAFYSFDLKNGDILDFRNVRVYEITQAEYNALDTMTADQVGIKYPYVDDVRPVINPYIEWRENMFTGNHNTLFHGAIDGGTGWYYSATTNPEYKNIAILTGNDDFSSIQQYTISSDVSLPTGVRLLLQCRDKNNVSLASIIVTSLPSTFTPNTNTSKINLMFVKDDSTDITSQLPILQSLLKSLTIVKGVTPKMYTECHNSRIMFDTKLYSGEKITRGNDGKYRKNSEYENISIGPNDTFMYYGKSIDKSKTVIAVSTLTYPINTAISASVDIEKFKMVRYDGMIVSHAKHDALGTSTEWIDNSLWHFGGSTAPLQLFISLPNTLTGWGDNYGPTPDEIRAFFLGWRMYEQNSATGYPNYNGTGVKAWAKFWCGIGEKNSVISSIINATMVTTCPTTLNDQGYTPYKLIYKKAAPTVEEVKTYGALSTSDDGVITAGSGLVLGNINKIDVLNGVYRSHYVGDSIGRVDYTLKVYKDNTVYPVTNYVSSSPIQVGLNYSTIPNNTDDGKILVDYLIYKPDTVQSYDYTITTIDDLKEVVRRTVEENNALSQELAGTKLELVRAKIELSQRSNPTLILNGGCDIAQRGTTFTVSVEQYTLDRWLTISSIVSKVDRIVNTSPAICDYAMRVTCNVSNSYNIVCQPLENYNSLKGKTITVSFWGRAIKNTMRLFATVGPTASNVSLTTQWRYYSCTMKVPEAIYVYDKGLRFSTDSLADNTMGYELAGIKLELGEYATPFVPHNLGKELTLCQRYYTKLPAASGILGHYQTATGGHTTGVITLPTRMRLASTMKTTTGIIQGLESLDMGLITLDSNYIYGFNITYKKNNNSVYQGKTIYLDVIEADAEIY